MKIVFYKNSAEPIRVNKEEYLTQVITLTGTLRRECSILTPSIDIEYNSMMFANYAYIEEFERYYYITNITSVRNGLWRVDFQVDTLMSFKSSFLPLNAFITRQENSYNAMLIDEVMPFKPRPTYYRANLDFGRSMFYPNNSTFQIFVGIAGNAILRDKRKEVVQNGDLWCRPATILSPVARTCRVYMFTTEFDFEEFIGKVASDSALASQVIFIRILPVVTGFVEGTDYVSRTAVVMAGTNGDRLEIPCECKELYEGVSLTQTTTVLIDLPNQSFINNPPYTQYRFYIPLYGWVEIEETQQFLGRYVTIFTTIDITNGTAQTTIYTANSQYNEGSSYKNVGFVSTILASVSYTVGSDLPITYTGSADAIRQAEANLVRYNANNTKIIADGIANQFTHAVGAANSAISGNIGGAVTGVFQNISDVVGMATDLVVNNANYEAQRLVNVSRGGSTPYSSVWNSYYSGFNFILQIIQYEPTVNFEEFAKYAGRPLNQYKILQSLTGFTVIGDIFIDNIPVATIGEIRVLKEIFSKGIIL